MSCACESRPYVLSAHQEAWLARNTDWTRDCKKICWGGSYHHPTPPHPPHPHCQTLHDMMIRQLLLTSALLAIAVPAQAAQINVQPGNLQRAINDANDGDELILANGTYSYSGPSVGHINETLCMAQCVNRCYDEAMVTATPSQHNRGGCNHCDPWSLSSECVVDCIEGLQIPCRARCQGEEPCDPDLARYIDMSNHVLSIFNKPNLTLRGRDTHGAVIDGKDELGGIYVLGSNVVIEGISIINGIKNIASGVSRGGVTIGSSTFSVSHLASRVAFRDVQFDDNKPDVLVKHGGTCTTDSEIDHVSGHIGQCELTGSPPPAPPPPPPASPPPDDGQTAQLAAAQIAALHRRIAALTATITANAAQIAKIEAADKGSAMGIQY